MRCSANRRSAAFAAFSTSASSAVDAPKVTARFARALKSPVRVSAGHQQTPAYRPLKRCAYSIASEVFPTPPMPCTAARPTDCVTAAGLSCTRMASSRSSSSVRPMKLAMVHELRGECCPKRGKASHGHPALRGRPFAWAVRTARLSRPCWHHGQQHFDEQRPRKPIPGLRQLC